MAPRVYATIADYRAASGDSATPDVRVTRLLTQASITIDRALIGAIYPVDVVTLMPTDPVDIDTFNRATCAQAQFIVALDDPTGAASRMDSVSIGGISIHRAAGTTGLSLPPLAPAALEILHLAGASPVSPMSNW